MSNKEDFSQTKFHNERLNALFHRYRTVFDSNSSELNKMSDDIKQLEEFLRAKCLKTEFSYDLPSDEAARSSICWGVPDDHHSFRLILSEWWLHGEEVRFKRIPLISAPTQIRKTAYRVLPDFYEAFARHVSIAPLEDLLPF